MARLDRAIALFIALLLMARSSRTMTFWCLTFQRFRVLVTCRSALLTAYTIRGFKPRLENAHDLVSD